MPDEENILKEKPFPKEWQMWKIQVPNEHLNDPEEAKFGRPVILVETFVDEEEKDEEDLTQFFPLFAVGTTNVKRYEAEPDTVIFDDAEQLKRYKLKKPTIFRFGKAEGKFTYDLSIQDFIDYGEYVADISKEDKAYIKKELNNRVGNFTKLHDALAVDIEEDIEKHDELNQKLFDGDELRQDVKDKVVEIANAFVDELKADGIKFNLKDIVLIGSNVNYNYTKDSDLDIHLIADSEGLECPDELYPLLYSAYRSIFNKNYEIKIKGIPAEIYVEMDEPQGVSNGIYSIENGWVKKPVQTDIPDIDREKLDDELSKWEDKYFELRDRIEYALASTEHPLDESLIRESALDESAKTDFIAKFGEDTAKNFEKAKQRLLNKGLSVDYGQYLKYDKKQLDDLLLSLYDDKKDAQKKRVMSGKTREVRGKYNFLGEKNGYLVYEPLDYVASMDLGINTGWCTTGRYGHAGHPEYNPSAKDAKKHWNNYTKKGVRFFYFLDPSTFYGEYALALYPRTINVNEFLNDNEYLKETNFELFNQKDYRDYSELNSLPIDLINAKLVIKRPKVVNGLALSDDGTEIVKASTSLKSVTIPNSVTKIGDLAFFGCAYLKSVAIPDDITRIGKNAFRDCGALKSITIPNSVTSIGEDAFFACRSLESITVSDSVTEIGRAVFAGCTSLKSIMIPSGITRIGESAFFGCASLTSITIPKSVTEIGGAAFYDCESLTSITISDSVTEIGIGAFAGCKSLTSITIPNSVTSIGDDAFSRCDSLTSITIPNSVTSIGMRAFAGCVRLTVHTNNEYAIQYCEKNGIKYVRDAHESLKEEYVDDDKEIFTTESPYEVANMLRSSEKALRILYDRKLKRFFVCDADELIHREMVDAAWERGYYAQLAQSGVLRGKWELDSYLDDYGGHVIYYIYAPLDKVADTYGSDINEDGYEGKYVYDFGVVTTRSDDKYKSSPLGKALGKYQHHYVQDGWIDDYTPKIIEVA